MFMGKNSWIVLLVLCVGIGCTRQVTISPESVSPGDEVQITDPKAQFDEKKELRVTIGKEPTSVSAIEATTIYAIVPNIAPGKAEVAVKSGTKILGTGQVLIRSAGSKRVTLSLEDGDIRFLRSKDLGGQSNERAESDGMRLAYDVLTADGNLVFSGAIVHPTKGRHEVFDDPETGRMHGIAPPQRAVFSLKIPYVPGKTVIRFYEAGPQLDLSRQGDRQRRTFLKEINIEEQEVAR